MNYRIRLIFFTVKTNAYGYHSICIHVYNPEGLIFSLFSAILLYSYKKAAYCAEYRYLFFNEPCRYLFLLVPLGLRLTFLASLHLFYFNLNFTLSSIGLTSSSSLTNNSNSPSWITDKKNLLPSAL